MAGCNEEFIGRLIYLTARELQNFAEKLLKPVGLTMEQFHLLKALVDQSGVSQKQLGDIVGKSPANITRILDRMEAKDLVSRQGDPDDRRSLLVFLNEKGASLVDDVLGVFNGYSSLIVSGIDEREQQMARKVLLKIVDNIRMMDEESTKTKR